MATIPWAIEMIKPGVIRADVTLDGGDTSDMLSLPDYPDKTIQVSGTFGTSTVDVEGSNLEAGTPRYALHQVNDPANDFSALAAAVGAAVLENPSAIFADANAGSGTDLIVSIIARTGRPV